MTSIKYNFIEIKKLRRELADAASAGAQAVNTISRKIAQLDNLIYGNDHENQKWIIELPQSFFDELRSICIQPVISLPKLKWRTIVVEMIRKHNMPMDTNLIYNKVMQSYPGITMDHQSIRKNITAALASLYRDETLLRFNLNGKKNYVYGFLDFIDGVNGALLTEFKEKYEFETNKAK